MTRKWRWAARCEFCTGCSSHIGPSSCPQVAQSHVHRLRGQCFYKSFFLTNPCITAWFLFEIMRLCPDIQNALLRFFAFCKECQIMLIDKAAFYTKVLIILHRPRSFCRSRHYSWTDRSPRCNFGTWCGYRYTIVYLDSKRLLWKKSQTLCT